MSLIKNTNQAQFKADVFDSELPVVVQFSADWCSPCQAMSRALEAVLPQFEGKLSVVKVDIDTSPDIASKFGIRSIPTLMVFTPGNETPQSSNLGAMTESQLSDFLAAI